MGEGPKRVLGVPEPQILYTAGESRLEVAGFSSSCSLLTLNVRSLGSTAAGHLRKDLYLALLG